jgi:hypothetical protein
MPQDIYADNYWHKKCDELISQKKDMVKDKEAMYKEIRQLQKEKKDIADVLRSRDHEIESIQYSSALVERSQLDCGGEALASEVDSREESVPMPP